MIKPPIFSILDESRQHYVQNYKHLVAQVLVNEAKGCIVRRGKKEVEYIYNKFYLNKKSVEKYIGKSGLSSVNEFLRLHRERIESAEQIKECRMVLKELKVADEVSPVDFQGTVHDVLCYFQENNLFEEGIELIGSWCFKVYQNECGVEFYPERTLDIDFAVEIPKKPSANIAEGLKSLGFKEEYNYGDGSVRFATPSLVVDFVANRVGDGEKRSQLNPYKDIGLLPQEVPFLSILLDNPMEIRLRGVGNIRLPAMGAFALHKVLVAGERSDENKSYKDLKQANKVAKAVLGNDDQYELAKKIASDLPKSWRKKITKSAQKAGQMLGQDAEAITFLMFKLSNEKGLESFALEK